MKGSFLFMVAGKGHFIPAMSLAEGFSALGNEAIVEDFFTIVQLPKHAQRSRNSWKFCIKHPLFERLFNPLIDYEIIFAPLLRPFRRRKNYFLEWYNRTRPDFIFCTHYVVSRAVIAIIRDLKLKIPVYTYAPDIFFGQRTSVSSYFSKYFISSHEGADIVANFGQPRQTIQVVPFPLQKTIEQSKPLSKDEAREKLGLAKKFTIQLTLGGEGIGNTRLLFELAKREFDIQVIVLGQMTVETKQDFDDFKKKFPRFLLITPGFISNVDEYGYAADLLVGKAGTNTLMEGLYMHRPCLITSLFSSAKAAAKYLKDNGVGWCTESIGHQLHIIEECMRNPTLLGEMQDRMQRLDLQFNTEEFAKILIQSTLDFNQKQIW